MPSLQKELRDLGIKVYRNSKTNKLYIRKSEAQVALAKLPTVSVLDWVKDNLGELLESEFENAASKVVDEAMRVMPDEVKGNTSYKQLLRQLTQSCGLA